MRHRQSVHAVVTIQAARIAGLDFYGRPNPFVRVLVMVPKGKLDVTVPTNCVTPVQDSIFHPVWNATFSIPVRRDSDILVFHLLDRETAPAPRLRRAAAAATAAAAAAAAVTGTNSMTTPRETPRPSAEEADAIPSTEGLAATDTPAAAVSVPPPSIEGRHIGACMFPVDTLPESGEVVRQRLELFVDTTEGSGAGSLYIAAKLVKVPVDMLEKSDLHTDLISQFHSKRLDAFQDRFIGIGELAAFLYEEGYSDDIDTNWDRAVTILAEQLAYRIFETTGSTSDRSNFAAAKAQVERDQGLWDGI
jgi:C2 domain